MSEERIIIIKSSKLTSGSNNNYYYDITGVLPLNVINIKVKALRTIIPNTLGTYNTRYIQVLIDFNCGSNQYSQIQNNLSLLDIINVANDSFYYDTVAANAVGFLLMNSEQSNIINNIEYKLLSRPNNLINIQLQNDLNTVLLYTAGNNPSNHIVILKFNYDLI